MQAGNLRYKEGIDEEDEVYNYRITMIYDFIILGKLVKVDKHKSCKSVLKLMDTCISWVMIHVSQLIL